MDKIFEQQLNQILAKEKELYSLVNKKLPLYSSFGRYEAAYLSKSILEKLISIQEAIKINEHNLLLNQASLRYTLEALIQVELLIREPEYVFVLFYSIHNHQIDKRMKFIEKLNSEIEIVSHKERLFAKYLAALVMSKDKNKDDETIKNEMMNFERKLIRDILDDEITIYFNVNYTTSEHLVEHSYLLKNDLLKDFEFQLSEVKKENEQKAKEILKDKRINKLFDFKRQHSRVFKELKDARSWKTKAQVANLSEEYKLVYDITSSLLHCTSYSLITSNEATNDETDMSISLMIQYSTRIINKLTKYLEIERFKKFEVYVIDEEE